MERILDAEMDAEMDAHLEGEQARGESNRRNGHNRKRVLSGDGEMELEAPRDRGGTFEPLFVEKYRRRLPGFDERVVSLYAKGSGTREIRREIGEAYGVGVSADLVSRVTDAVHGEIYGAATVGQAEAALEAFESGEWNEKYPAVARSWRANWERVIPFLAFSENVRKAVYTTNQIESPDSSLRRAVRRRGHFPGDDAARKLLYLALRDIAARWRGPPAYWPEASREFAIQFGERFRILD